MLLDYINKIFMKRPKEKNILYWVNREFVNIFTIFIMVFILFVPFFDLEALSSASDRLSLTWPSTASNHSITFKLTKSIPPGGKILIIPQSGEFFISQNFDYRNIDLATSTFLNATFYDRSISSTSSLTEDGINVVASSSNGSIEIVLNSSQGINAESYVNIELGTNASFEATSSSQIINPSTVGSYKIDIKTFDNNDNYLERAVVMIAVVEPVNMGAYAPKVRSNGTPSGVLNFGTVQTIMSLVTNYAADCRWSNTASTTYSSMTETFDNTGGFYHSSIISGFVNGLTYYYYVRCLDEDGVADETDFEITFMIAGFEGEGGDEDVDGVPGSGGAGPGIGGGGGGGAGSGTGIGDGEYLPYPELPGSPIVAFGGWAYPASKVVLLIDGEESQTVLARTNGSFEIGVLDLNQGVYTFSLLGEDKYGQKSAIESFTFYVKEGTKTELSDIYFPPTINASKSSFEIGDSLEILGQSAPDSSIDLWLYPKVVGGVVEDAVLKYQGTTTSSGDWNFNLNTDKLINGPYQVKARSSLTAIGESEFSKIIDLMVGSDLPIEVCAGADLNNDGKVNITDFSILLYWWSRDNECADQNNDGTVDLIDFSIMMYNWTG